MSLREAKRALKEQLVKAKAERQPKVVVRTSDLEQVLAGLNDAENDFRRALAKLSGAG